MQKQDRNTPLGILGPRWTRPWPAERPSRSCWGWTCSLLPALAFVEVGTWRAPEEVGGGAGISGGSRAARAEVWEVRPEARWLGRRPGEARFRTPRLVLPALSTWPPVPTPPGVSHSANSGGDLAKGFLSPRRLEKVTWQVVGPRTGRPDVFQGWLGLRWKLGRLRTGRCETGVRTSAPLLFSPHKRPEQWGETALVLGSSLSDGRDVAASALGELIQST